MLKNNHFPSFENLPAANRTVRLTFLPALIRFRSHKRLLFTLFTSPLLFSFMCVSRLNAGRFCGSLLVLLPRLFWWYSVVSALFVLLFIFLLVSCISLLLFSFMFIFHLTWDGSRFLLVLLLCGFFSGTLLSVFCFVLLFLSLFSCTPCLLLSFFVFFI